MHDEIDQVEALRHLPYAEYLKTMHWQKERKGALHRAAYSCQVCKRNDMQLEVHHNTYERLGQELPSDLLVLCEECHTLFSTNGRLVETGLEAYEETEEEWGKDTAMQVYEEPEVQGRFQVILHWCLDHPRLSLGGGSLFFSVTADMVFRLDPLWMVMGLGASVALLIKGNDLALGLQKLLIPGSDQEQVIEDADHFADRMLDGYPVYADQSALAKLRRLFHLEEGEVVEAIPQKEAIVPKKQNRKRGKDTVTNAGEEGLTFERIATWLVEGRIDDVQFFALLERMDNPNSAVTRNWRNEGAKPPPDADVSGQNSAVTPVTLPPGWTEEDLLVLPRLYRIENNIDKCLTGIGVSTSQDNRRFAREILREQGLLKEK